MTVEQAFRSMISDEVERVVRKELALVRPAAAPAAAPPKQLLLVADVQLQCGLKSPETVRGWIRSGRLVARKAGHQWVVKPGDLELFLATEKARAPKVDLAPDEHMDLIMRRVAARSGR